MNEFFTWTTLATYAGATLATSLITQLIKGLGFIDKIPTRITSYAIALVVLIAATFFTGGLTLEVQHEQASTRFKRLEDKFERQELTNQAIMDGLVAIINHSIDGNGIEGLKKAREELLHHIIERG